MAFERTSGVNRSFHRLKSLVARGSDAATACRRLRNEEVLYASMWQRNGEKENKRAASKGEVGTIIVKGEALRDQMSVKVDVSFSAHVERFGTEVQGAG